MIKTQFTVYLENRPGALGAITRSLAAKKVNIEGISVASTADVGLVQIVVSDAEATRDFLTAANVPFTVQDVALVSLSNQPGALSDVVSRLGQANVNINYVYATSCECEGGCRCYAVISAPDLDAVESMCAGA